MSRAEIRTEGPTNFGINEVSNQEWEVTLTLKCTVYRI